MKFCLLLTVIVQLAFCTVDAADQFHLDGSNYYVSTPDKANWYQAMRFCAYNGMYLIDVRTPFENGRVLSVIQMAYKRNNVTSGDFWTSGTDLGSDKEYYWASNGHQIFWEYWAYAEPSVGGGEHCVHYYFGKDSKWNNIGCDVKMYFICRDTFDVPMYEYKNRECAAVLG